MIKIYDDTNESTVPLDLKMSRSLILLITAVCLIIVLLGAFNGERLFEVPVLYGVAAYFLAGASSIGLYFVMYRVQRYPTLYSSLSFLCLGIAIYLSGVDERSGMLISLFAIGYIVLYLALVKLFNIDDPDI